MEVRRSIPEDHDRLIELLVDYRVTLDRFRGLASQPDMEGARAELEAFQQPGFHIFVAESDEETLVGMVVCRVAGQVVWAECLFVKPEFRRQGVATRLYEQVERLNQEVGGKTVYNWIHPNNDRIIRFLQRRGYTVLNLVEVRGPLPDEELNERIKVGPHTYDY